MSLLSHIVDKKILHLLFRSTQRALVIEQNSARFLHQNQNRHQDSLTTTVDAKQIAMTTEKAFIPKKALILRKFSRLEYERLCHPDLTEVQLADDLNHRGSVYESLVHYDQVQKSCLRQIESVLATNNIKYFTVDRFGYTEDKIDWADVIITSGGDGTFLMAASKVTTRNKPVIGINSDPTKSVGHLCLPSKYSNNFDKVIDLLKRGKFQWQFKQRLRVTLIGEAADEDPRELNDIRYNLRGINQFLDQDDSQDQQSPARSRSPFQHGVYQQLPGPLNLRYPAVLPPNSTTTSMSHTDIAHMVQSDDNSVLFSTPNHNDTYHQHPQNQFQQDSINTSAFASISTNNASTSNHPAQPMEVVTDSTNSTTTSDTSSHQQLTGFDQTGNSFRTVDGKIVHKIRQLKERALNEVFVGETLSARVSYYELSIDNNRLIKMKSSGLTVCTGTGSTSWYYNINKLTEQQVQSIVDIINKVTNTSKLQVDDMNLIGNITKQFNETLTFAATEPIMAYSIRDPVDYATNGGHSHRGNAKRIEVKSRMQNACLVLDGCQFYPFNDGSYALIEMYDEDALKTISVE